MKKLFFILTVVFACHSISLSQEQIEIYFKSGTVQLDPDRAGRNIDPVSQDEVIDGKIYRLLVFHSIPSDAVKQMIKGEGIHLLEYIPRNTFIASLPANYPFARLADFGIVAVKKMQPEYKIDPLLKNGPYPAHIRDAGGKLLIKVMPMYRLPVEETVRSALAATGGDWISYQPGKRYASIAIDAANLMVLAAHPAVYWIEPEAAPPVPDDIHARGLHRNNMLDAEYPGGRKYDGTGVSVALADDGGVGPHIDFTGRIDQSNVTGGLGGTHGDMTAGIIAGAGNLDPTVKGMATGCFLWVYEISGYPHINNAVSNLNNHGIVITSTSYSQGCNAGYTTDTQEGDQQIRQNPPLIHVFSAGNSAASDCGYGAGPPWGTITGGYKQGKNVIAVGNLNAIEELTSSSSRGPAEDGRIKPDICANGTNQMSTDPYNTYAPGGGTSAAAPGIAGILAQMYQAYREMNGGNNPESSLLKACLLNTAYDLGNPGPDFTYGWGRVNAFRALRILEQQRYFPAFISQGMTNTHTINVPAGTRQLRLMVYWLDYEGSPVASKALVNDINCTLTSPSGTTYQPWVLDPTPNASNLSAPAVRGVDDLNNMEQITIDNPPAGNYTLSVNGFSIPQGPQKYYVVWEYLNDSIIVTYPAGGEGFVPGETEIIRWDAYGSTGNFTLEYSTDNGNSWNLITTGIPGAQRYYQWTVPNVITGKARIRVSRTGQIAGISPHPFTIIGLPQLITVTSACPDSVILTWQPVNGATHYEVSMLGNMYMDSVATVTTTSATIKNINGSLEHWFSVTPLGPDGIRGRRAVAVNKPPGLFNCPLPYDVAVTEIVSPAGYLFDCHNTTSVTVRALLTNEGTNPASGFTVKYSVNGSSPASTAFTATLPPGSDTIITFPVTANLSVPGIYEIMVWVDFSGDLNSQNDSLSQQVNSLISQTVTAPYSHNLETFNSCSTANDCEQTSCGLGNGWINATNSLFDDIDWRVDADGTPSSNTGPATDHNPGTSTGKYIYTEASNGCSYKTAMLYSPCLDLTQSQNPVFSFWYHMYGADMGSLHLDIYHNGRWINDIMPVISGDQGNVWQQAQVYLAPYAGNIVNLRIRGITGGDYQSDLALDDFELSELQQAPGADFYASETVVCPGSAVHFYDLSEGASAWQWTFIPSTVTYVNGTGPNSRNPVVVFDSIGSYTVQLMATNGYGSDIITKTAYITVSAAPSFPLLQTFETASLCGTDYNCELEVCPIPGGWVNATNNLIDDIDWRVDEGGTPSQNTGPSVDHTFNSSLGNYVYLEASNGCNFKEAHLISPCIDLTNMQSAWLTFWYHMYGQAMGVLHVDVLYNGIWTEDVITPISGDKGNTWHPMQVDLGNWLGKVIKIRLRGVTGSDYTSDMALDDIGIDGVPLPACETPANLHVSRLTPVSARLNWTPVNNAVKYEIRGRKLGNPQWTYLQVNNGNTAFRDVYGLYNNNAYEWQVRAYCSQNMADTSLWSPLDTFITGCYPPDSIWTSPVTANAARLNWTKAPGAVGYEIRGQQDGSSSWINLIIGGGNTLSKDIYGLNPNTGYRWRIRTWCDIDGTVKSVYTPLTTFTTLNNSRLSGWLQKPDKLTPADAEVIPNPSDMQVTIRISGHVIYPLTATLMDITGKVLFEADNLTEGEFILDESTFNGRTGVFILRLSGATTVYKRIIRQ